MSLDYVKFTPGFGKFMPKEYRDMVDHGPFGKKTTVSQVGSFKEIMEEHPMCAGCAMTLFIRLAVIAFPNPEDTITVGTAGCGRLAISQAAIPSISIFSNFFPTGAIFKTWPLLVIPLS